MPNRAAAGQATGPEDGVVGPLDLSRAELLLSLDDGEGSVRAEIIAQYLAQTLEGRAELARVVGEGDTHALERLAHTLKGASATIGASALSAVCAEMEHHARSAQIEGAAGLLGRFDSEFARARDALDQLATRT